MKRNNKPKKKKIARRSTRVSRTISSSTTENDIFPSTTTTSSTTSTTTFLVLNTKSIQKVRRWIRVLRPPSPGIGFVVPKWVTVDELTEEERTAILKHSSSPTKNKEKFTSHDSTTPLLGDPSSDGVDGNVAHTYQETAIRTENVRITPNDGEQKKENSQEKGGRIDW